MRCQPIGVMPINGVYAAPAARLAYVAMPHRIRLAGFPQG